MITEQTKMCVRHPDRTATHFTGPVVKGDEQLIAGWCDECQPGFGGDLQGFFGQWTPEMGAKEWLT